MSIIIEASISRPLTQQPRLRDLQVIRALLIGLNRLCRLPALLLHLRSPDEPGDAVQREFGLGRAATPSFFDFTDVHHGIESSRLRMVDMNGPGWRGS